MTQNDRSKHMGRNSDPNLEVINEARRRYSCSKTVTACTMLYAWPQSSLEGPQDAC